MASEIKTWVGKLGDQDPAVAFEAYKKIEKAVTRAGAPGKQREAAELADALAAELIAKTAEETNKKDKKIPPKPVHSSEVRNKLCRLLAYVADGKQVPALVQQLGDLDVREMARWALDRNRSDQATEALIAALKEIGPVFRVGVVGALGVRQGDRVAAALRKVAMEDHIPEVRLAAVEVLPNFPDGDSAAVIMKATLAADKSHARRAYRAAIRLIDNLIKAGKKNEALGLCRMIAAGPAPDPQRKTARAAMEALK